MPTYTHKLSKRGRRQQKKVVQRPKKAGTVALYQAEGMDGEPHDASSEADVCSTNSTGQISDPKSTTVPEAESTSEATVNGIISIRDLVPTSPHDIGPEETAVTDWTDWLPTAGEQQNPTTHDWTDFLPMGSDVMEMILKDIHKVDINIRRLAAGKTTVAEEKKDDPEMNWLDFVGTEETEDIRTETPKDDELNEWMEYLDGAVNGAAAEANRLDEMETDTSVSDDCTAGDPIKDELVVIASPDDEDAENAVWKTSSYTLFVREEEERLQRLEGRFVHRVAEPKTSCYELLDADLGLTTSAYALPITVYRKQCRFAYDGFAGMKTSCYEFWRIEDEVIDSVAGQYERFPMGNLEKINDAAEKESATFGYEVVSLNLPLAEDKAAGSSKTSTTYESVDAVNVLTMASHYRSRFCKDDDSDVTTYTSGSSSKSGGWKSPRTCSPGSTCDARSEPDHCPVHSYSMERFLNDDRVNNFESEETGKADGMAEMRERLDKLEHSNRVLTAAVTHLIQRLNQKADVDQLETISAKMNLPRPQKIKQHLDSKSDSELKFPAMVESEIDIDSELLNLSNSQHESAAEDFNILSFKPRVLTLKEIIHKRLAQSEKEALMSVSGRRQSITGSADSLTSSFSFQPAKLYRCDGAGKMVEDAGFFPAGYYPQHAEQLITGHKATVNTEEKLVEEAFSEKKHMLAWRPEQSAILSRPSDSLFSYQDPRFANVPRLPTFCIPRDSLENVFNPKLRQDDWSDAESQNEVDVAFSNLRRSLSMVRDSLEDVHCRRIGEEYGRVPLLPEFVDSPWDAEEYVDFPRKHYGQDVSFATRLSRHIERCALLAARESVSQPNLVIDSPSAAQNGVASAPETPAYQNVTMRRKKLTKRAPKNDVISLEENSIRDSRRVQRAFIRMKEELEDDQNYIDHLEEMLSYYRNEAAELRATLKDHAGVLKKLESPISD